MENLYVEKGGTQADFNCASAELVAEDIDMLELVVREDRLPNLASPQSGDSYENYLSEDLEFISKARDAFSIGRTVAYYAFW